MLPVQAAEQAKYDQQKIARYGAGEENVAWEPTTWHNVLGARKAALPLWLLSAALSCPSPSLSSPSV